jgi:plastocyanin
MTRLGVTVVALALVAVACSSGATAEDGDVPFEVRGEAVATTTVELPRSYRYAPAVIEVEAGAEVTWTNADDFPHNVTLLDGSDEVLDLPIGGTATFTFDEAGTVYYQCSLRPQQMKGKVIVTA